MSCSDLPSALRVLCLPHEVADRILALLLGALAEQRLGGPERLATDIGPVIDAPAREAIEQHIAAMAARWHRVHQPLPVPPELAAQGCFVAPTVIEIDHIGQLQREVFGPVLHLLRYRPAELDALLRQIEATGYGLTLGVHTRIDAVAEYIASRARAGNVYVNRNMVGAVVGVQPFGGEGLSGTGPKAGGPLYLYRLLRRAPVDALARALAYVGGCAATGMHPSLQALAQWAQTQGRHGLAQACARYAALACWQGQAELAGPSGERNRYSLRPRRGVLTLAQAEEDRLLQLAATLAVGATAVWPADAAALRGRLPAAVQAAIALTPNPWGALPDYDVALHHGTPAQAQALCAELAQRPGPVVTLHSRPPGCADIALQHLVVERSVSINTAAAAGNASLLTLD